LGTVALQVSLWICRLGSFVWGPSLDNFRLGSFAWELTFGIFRWELSLGIFRLGTIVDPSLGNFRLGPQAWGTGLLRLGEPLAVARGTLRDWLP
jgi:hypothetical protein